MKQQTVIFDDEQHDRLIKLAKENDRSFSKMAVILIKEALKQREKKK